MIFFFCLKLSVKSASISDQTVHPTLCKTTSEPPRFSRQNSTPNNSNSSSVNNDINTKQNE